MIDSSHSDNDKTPSLSDSQHVMLRTIYSTRALPRNFEDDIFKKLEKKISKSLLNELATHAAIYWGPSDTVWGLVMAQKLQLS